MLKFCTNNHGDKVYFQKYVNKLLLGESKKPNKKIRQ